MYFVTGQIPCTPLLFAEYGEMGWVVGCMYLIHVIMVGCWWGVLVLVYCVLRCCRVVVVNVVI